MEPCDTDAPEEYYMQGNVFYEKGEFEKAIEWYDKAINCSPEGNPHLYRYHYNRGLAYACLERYTKATSDVEKVVELYPEFPEELLHPRPHMRIHERAGYSNFLS